MAHPIWQDYLLRPNGSSVNFQISYNGSIVYEGRATARSTSERVKIKINDICASYIENAFPSSFPNTSGEEAQYVFPFDIVTINENGEVEESTVEFLYDWSYDYAKGNSVLLSAPILRKIPRNAPLLYSATSGTTYIELIENGGFSVAFNSAFDIGGTSTLNGESIANNIFNLAELAKPTDVYVKVYGGEGLQPITYTIVDGCYRYMLYYRNAYGGWDFLLVEGKSLQTDNYTRHTFGQSYDNTQSRNRAMVNYRNDIKRKWTLGTLWINDEGCANMHHLLGSTEVFLYDMNDGNLYPVVVDNSSCEYRNYSNNGNQLVRFDIEVSSANNIMRR